MLEILDFYKQSPPSDLRVQGACRILIEFLERDVKRWSIGEQLRFTIPAHHTSALMNYHRELGSNLENSSIHFKVLFNFLTQSSAEGVHKKALEAFNIVANDFITRVNSILADV